MDKKRETERERKGGENERVKRMRDFRVACFR